MMRISSISSSALALCAVFATTLLSAAELPKNPAKLAPDARVDAYLAVAEDTSQTVVKRNYALEKIAAMGAEAVPHLTDLFRTAGADRRDLLARIFAGMKDAPDEVKTLLLDDFRRRRLKTHPSVVQALGQLEVADARPLLLELLPQAQGELRVAMMRALGPLADASAVDALADALDSDDRLVRVSATRGVLELLVRLKPGKTSVAEDHPYHRLRDRVIKYIREGKRSDVRRMLVTGVVVCDERDVSYTLRRILRLESGSLQIAAAGSLGRLKDRSAVDQLARLVGSEDRALRRAVVDALGDIGDPGCIPDLIGRLEVADPAERRGVVKTLRRISGERFGDNPEQWWSWWRKRSNRG